MNTSQAKHIAKHIRLFEELLSIAIIESNQDGINQSVRALRQVQETYGVSSQLLTTLLAKGE